ncbi:MAG TPA: LCP family protein [Acidimicrobiales bacterium]|nr:LCP family protein [Acidimicrobiales bacterium]
MPEAPEDSDHFEHSLADEPTDNGDASPASGTVADDGPTAHSGPVESPSQTLAPKGSWRERWREKRSRQSKLHRRITRTVEVIAVVLFLVIGSSAGYLFYQLNSIARVNVKLTPAAKAGTVNILLLGSTSRCAITPAKNFENFVKQCQDNVNGVNSDVIMILRLVPNRTPVLLSIPRDTFLPDARYGGLYNKIDAALANGPSQLVTAIQQDFGISINHFVLLNFESFANIVTTLGGITMYFPTSLRDVQSGLLISHSGCLHISGLEALALVRARHLQYDYNKKTHQWLGYDGSGDIGRIERIHVFLKVLGQEVARRGLGNPVTDSSLLSTIAPDLTLDTTFGNREIINLLLGYHSKIASVTDLTLPIVEDTQTYYYKGYNYGYIVFPTQPQDQSTIDQFTGGSLGGASVHPLSVTVSVVNGTSNPKAGSVMAAGLRGLGFKVTEATSRNPVGSIVETTVDYANPSHLGEAERVLRSLSGVAVLAQTPTVGGADVTVVTGTDVAVTGASSIKTSAAPITASTPFEASIIDSMLLSALGNSSSTTTTNPALASPTTAATSIAPYDPRACPTS